jgi:hypothetical protein
LEVKEESVGEIMLMRDADDDRRTYGRGGDLSTTGDAG